MVRAGNRLRLRLLDTLDAAGNQTVTNDSAAGRTTYVWDNENRQTLARLTTGTRVTFSYNGDGRRVQRQSGTATTKFIWDGQTYLAETDASDVTQAVYTQEPLGYGSLISRKRSAETAHYYFHFDAVGSTRTMTNDAAAVLGLYIYDAFGNTRLEQGGLVNPFRYVGQLGYYYDTATQNYHLRARDYRPVIMRFLSADPAQAEPNAYRYVRNYPCIYVDPSGLKIHVENPEFSYVSDSWYDAKKKEGFVRQVMLALQSVIGDCAKLRLTNEKTRTLAYGPGGHVTYLVSADIEHYGEKQRCKNNCCWQDLKKALDADKVYNVGYTASLDPNTDNNWNSENNTAYVNPNFHPNLWELSPGGYLVAAPISFEVFLWHELIGHGVYGYQHSTESGNWIDPKSKYYDPVIQLENLARKCLGLRERVHQYFGAGKEPKPGQLRPYYKPVPAPPRRRGPGPWIGPAPR